LIGGSVTARIIGAWVCSIFSLLFLLISDPGGIVRDSAGPYDYISLLVAGVGGALGWSTWRKTEKSKVGLAGGILGNIVFLVYAILIILDTVKTAQGG
jgi:hypothetical protein